MTAGSSRRRRAILLLLLLLLGVAAVVVIDIVFPPPPPPAHGDFASTIRGVQRSPVTVAAGTPTPASHRIGPSLLSTSFSVPVLGSESRGPTSSSGTRPRAAAAAAAKVPSPPLPAVRPHRHRRRLCRPITRARPPPNLLPRAGFRLHRRHRHHRCPLDPLLFPLFLVVRCC